MSRTKQQLINYHTRSKSAMPSTTDVNWGEIVVRNNYEAPQILIKVSEGTEGAEGYREYFVPFIASGQVETAINAAIAQYAGENANDLQGIRDSIAAVSGTVTETYWSSADTKTYVDNAKNEAIETSSGYTDQQIVALSGNIVSAITEVTTGDLSDIKSKIQALETFSGVVESDYATKEFVGAASGYAYTKAMEDVIGAEGDNADADTIWGAKAYADSLNDTLSGDVETAIAAEKTRAENAENALGERIDVMSGTVNSISGDVVEYIDQRLTTVYKFKGTVENLDELQAITDKEHGDVYNMVRDSGDPELGNFTPAGTNYAWNASANTWDALGGTIDVSGFATKAELSAATTDITELESKLNTTTGNLQTLSSSVETLSGKVVSDYATKESVSAEIAAASAASVNSAYTASVGYTDEQIAILSGISSAYTDSRITNVDNSINEIKQNYAYSSYTHNEIEALRDDILGDAESTSADTDTLAGLKEYSDQKDAELSANVTTIVENLSGITSGQIVELSGNVVTALDGIQSDVNDLKTSAATWNEKVGTAIQGAEFAAVTSSDTHFDGGEGAGATVDSNAKLSYTEGGNIKLDLSELIIDCGDF